MLFRIVRLIGVVITAAAAALALAAQNEPVSASSPLTLEKQGSFFVGGRDVHSDTLSMNPTCREFVQGLKAAGERRNWCCYPILGFTVTPTG